MLRLTSVGEGTLRLQRGRDRLERLLQEFQDVRTDDRLFRNALQRAPCEQTGFLSAASATQQSGASASAHAATPNATPARRLLAEQRARVVRVVGRHTRRNAFLRNRLRFVVNLLERRKVSNDLKNIHW